jgi:hypothetical protein
MYVKKKLPTENFIMPDSLLPTFFTGTTSLALKSSFVLSDNTSEHYFRSRNEKKK